MKKLLLIFALVIFAMGLFAQDIAEEFVACDPALEVLHTLLGPDGSVAPDGWLIKYVIDVAGDGIDGLDPATKQPLGDDLFTLNNNTNCDWVNGAAALEWPGCWYSATALLAEDQAGSPDEPVINKGDVMYFVLYNSDTEENATHYCTSTYTFTTHTTGGPYTNGIEFWNDTAWIPFSVAPSYNDATDPVPADGDIHVAADMQLAFMYDATGADAPAVLNVYLRAGNDSFEAGDIVQTITYTANGVYNVTTPALTNGETYYWMVEPTDGARAISRKANVAHRTVQNTKDRFPAWSFTVIGETQTQAVPSGGSATYNYDDGTQVQVNLPGGAGGNLTIVQWPEMPNGMAAPDNALPLWFNIDPDGTWTDFPINIVFTWTTPAPVADDYFELVYFNGTAWVAFDGVINGHNYLTSPYWVDFTTTHFTPFGMSDGSGTTLPVTFTSFSATFANTFDKVTLAWTTQSETEMVGYYILRSENNDVTTAVRVTDLIEATNSAAVTNYTATDNNIDLNKTYYYWVEGYQMDGQAVKHGSVQVTTNKPEDQIIRTTALNGAFPNPFNPSTTIAFSVKQGETGTLTIYNVLGQVVKTYPVYQGGKKYTETWTGRDDHNSTVGSGIYFYKLETQSYSKIMKMLLLK